MSAAVARADGPVPLRAFVQARMSSRRFPGKVLAPFLGRPLVLHVVERAAAALEPGAVTVLTSVHPSDDPLAAYLASAGIDVFRGPLDDVFGRFRACLAERPCSWLARICADSPLLDAELLRSMAALALDEGGREGWDVVTNVRPRTFPHGMSVELVRSAAFAAVDEAALTAEQREHVTQVFYAGGYRVRNVEAATPAAPGESVAVDTVDDLARLEAAAGGGAQ